MYTKNDISGLSKNDVLLITICYPQVMKKNYEICFVDSIVRLCKLLERRKQN